MYFEVLLIYTAAHDDHQVLGSKILDRSYVHVNQLLLFSFLPVKLREEFKKNPEKLLNDHNMFANSKQASKFLRLWLTLNSNLQQESSIGNNMGERRGDFSSNISFVLREISSHRQQFRTAKLDI